MPRLIDADALVEQLTDKAKGMAKIAESSCGQAGDYYSGIKTGFTNAAIVADSFPTIDAVPVVRCKDCKHRPIDTGGHNYGQELFFPDEDVVCPCQCGDQWYSWMPGDDWFCANGERKTDG